MKMMPMKFKKLFEPIRIGKAFIKNRIAMAPIHLINLNDSEGIITQRVIDYYVERAKGGVGLLITGVFHVANDIERLSLGGVPLWSVCVPKALPVLAELADFVHSYGSRVFIQLSPGCGRNADGAAIDEGLKPISASAVPAFYRPSVTARSLKTEEVEKMVEAFGPAAQLVATAEIDGIEVHGHEGYLLDQFTTALWNKRNDKYGGDLEGRLRFPIEIIQKIKDTVGKDYPVMYRYGLKHYMKSSWTAALRREGYVEAGRDVEEGLKMAELLEGAGVDALHVDAGCYESSYWAHPPIYQPYGCMADLAAETKKFVKIPVIAVGRLDIPEVAERVLEEGKADMVALGRALLADPYWPKKVQEGKLEDIVPCIGCHDGCMPLKGPLSCTVNPSCGRERLCALKPAAKPKRVLIAGGGVAGMEAARVAAIRGHKVALYEKTDRLGGHLIAASVPDFKQEIKMLLDWYKTQLRKLKVEVNLKTEVTPELVKREKPDVVIVATGSTPPVLEIPGINKPTVINCCDLLLGKEKAGDIVVVYGGGLEGCETALWLAKQGKSVTVVARHEAMTRGVYEANRNMLLDMLAENKVQILNNTIIQEATKDGVVVIDREFRRKVINCDTVILAIGLKPEKELYESLMVEFAELYEIGDCKEPRKIHHAIWDGYTVGYGI